ncbi:hypothetical protein PR048_010529 [Dryococelus australis]|uniref:Innexin n=1 Tax=Dryococelus australis TaxID=614101 RepID=A0ABQ9I2Z8_9NEOP|nr:hypothetical protein PR048_010529 [Dryococelus australis]
MLTRELAVYKTFKSIKDNFKLSARDVDIDNAAFKLHYRVTAIFLLSCTALVTTYQYFGGYIACVSDKGVANDVINTFCFFSSTFTVVKHFNLSSVRAGSALQPGVGPADQGKDDVVRHAYYQWVPFFLFAQALFFYAPHFVWKRAEGGALKSFVVGLEHLRLATGEKELQLKDAVVPSKKQRDAWVSSAGKAFVARRQLFAPWVGWLTACEMLCALNLGLQVAVVHAFLGGNFWDLVPGALDPEASAPRLDVVFPKLTKCTFHKYGPSGSIQNHDALCVMQLNLIYEKVFIGMWVWMMTLLLATAVGVAWRVGTIVLYCRVGVVSKAMLRCSYPGRMDDRTVDKVLSACDYPSWLFLCYLGGNMDSSTFKDVVYSVAAEVDAGVSSRDISSQETLPLNKDSSSNSADNSPQEIHVIVP